MLKLPVTILFFCLMISITQAQNTSARIRRTLAEVEHLLLYDRTNDAIRKIENALKSPENSSEDLAYLYANYSGLLVTSDSLLAGKKALDLSMENAKKDGSNEAVAMAYRAKGFLHKALGQPDNVVKDAKEALNLLGENSKDFKLYFALNYLLYGTYSQWKNVEKMEEYIRQCERYAKLSGNENLMANACNGISSMFLAKLEKTKEKKYADSSGTYLQKAFELRQKHPQKVAVNTFVITCINTANYFLEHSEKPSNENKQEAFRYLGFAEEELKKSNPHSEIWVNIFGIKSDFALRENDLQSAENYLLQGAMKLQSGNNESSNAGYMVYKRLAEMSVKKNDFQSAYNYRLKAEDILKKIFDQRQIFNSQKLEVLYETEKKERELQAQKKQKFLYGAITAACIVGLVFMFLSYHFRLRYSLEREKKTAQEKAESEQRASLQLQLEKEEQARLKAEQKLLEVQQQQLRKEALATTLMIEQKNEMLQLIRTKIEEGDAKDLRKLLKEETLVNNDFEEVKTHIQQLHPNFFNRLNELALRKLTPLDFKYCAYIHLQLTTRQIAQLLHVEEHSVRMFKYRLKQKFRLDKDNDLEDFLRNLV